MPDRPLQIITAGTGVVISAHRSRLAWVRTQLGSSRPDRIFGGALIARTVQYIMQSGQNVFGPALIFACSRDTLRPAALPDGITISLIERAGIAELYQYPGFSNALGYRTDHPRPDMLATVAIRDNSIVGIAGASADCAALWQIGIDVIEPERGSGIGRALVGRLAEAVLNAGRVPFYATTIANLRSQAVANALGFWPAWTQLSAVEYEHD
jgi:GNAT superfamily N-acetyltransferase